MKNKVPFILNFNVGGVLAFSRYDAILSGLSVMCSIVIGSHCTVEAHSVLTVLIGRRVNFAWFLLAGRYYSLVLLAGGGLRAHSIGYNHTVPESSVCACRYWYVSKHLTLNGQTISPIFTRVSDKKRVKLYNLMY